MNKKDILIKWNEVRGFGFVKSVDSKKETFIHIRNFKYSKFRPTVGQNITYKVVKSKNGEEHAIES